MVLNKLKLAQMSRLVVFRETRMLFTVFLQQSIFFSPSVLRETGLLIFNVIDIEYDQLWQKSLLVESDKTKWSYSE